ncbi:hypothetical protein [Ciceribacter sp. L1K22]|uniref:hypothetical protein n=1 Tax=Ciceribacter sp. L1K22 TaxID=2820275 RepID=UPI001ABEB80B|nr:hypothetical protein [Ciceribacter sp. L1K22]MBO3760348.1 hypothetical protein [Ciceribacter sp. L1K22]
MAVIKLSAFSGEKPILNARLLPDTAATEAFNVRLTDGALTPINKAVYIGVGAGAANHKTIYRHGGTWLSWSGLVDVAPGPVAQDRLYYTGDGAPKMLVGGTEYDLAVAKPAAALTATMGGTGSGDVQSRTYSYTYVTSFGEESAPCTASNIIDWQPGKTVTLSGFALPPSGRDITTQRIYRSQTGSAGTYFYLIAERAVSSGNFSDTVPVDAFLEPLPSMDWNTPPSNLKGLCAMPNGMMAGFVGKDVYFCEPWRPHAWPEKYVLTCDTDVVGLRAIGPYLVVMTKGQPYIFAGATPDTMRQDKLEANFACINERSIVDLGFAICYATNEGLVAVRADGSIGIVTEQLFNRDTWLTFEPDKIIAAQSNGNYVMFYNTTDTEGVVRRGAMMININAAQFLVRSSEAADAVFFCAEDASLYFKRIGSTSIFQFDSPDGSPDELFWRSKEFWLTAPVNFGAVLIDLGRARSGESMVNIEDEIEAIREENALLFAGDLLGALNDAELNVFEMNGDVLLPYPRYESVMANIYADGELFHSVSAVNRIARLPGGKTARKWEISVSANVQIGQITMATTIEELRNTL